MTCGEPAGPDRLEPGRNTDEYATPAPVDVSPNAPARRRAECVQMVQDAQVFAVVAGITYNFLPFTALPLYVALERIDKRLVGAAKDL